LIGWLRKKQTDDELLKGNHEVEVTLILRKTADYGFGELPCNAKVATTVKILRDRYVSVSTSKLVHAEQL